MSCFFNLRKPLITLMINSPKDYDSTIDTIKKGIENGTEAFGFCMNLLPPEYRVKECLSDIFKAMDGRPAYVTNYANWNADPSLSDEELAQQLILAHECGAKLIDIFGDMFCHSPLEITEDETAVRKQKKFAEYIHKKGGEVLISSHTQTYLPPEEVLRIARLQYERGADIAKIVTKADTDEELKNNFDTLFMLKDAVPCDTLFLCGGEKAYLHRRFGPIIANSSLFLCVNENETEQGNSQPTIDTVKKLLFLSEKGDLTAAVQK